MSHFKQSMMETESTVTESCSASAHALFQDNLPDFISLLTSCCTELATQLWGSNMINDPLYDSIVDKTDAVAMGPTTSHDMTRVMLHMIYKYLHNEPQEAKRNDIWSKFIMALKKESTWGDMVKNLETTVSKARSNNSKEYAEAVTLKRHMNVIAFSIEGGHLMLANNLEACGVLTFDEKQKCTDPTSQHDLIYTQKMLDEVGQSIKKNEERFDEFLKIMKKIGGPAETAAKNIQDLQQDPN